MIIRATS